MSKPFQFGIVLLLTAVVGGLVYQTVDFRTDRGHPFIRVKVEMGSFLTAMARYRVLYGYYPYGKPSEVLNVLSGNNPKKIQFINVGQGETNGSGDLIDPWQTPYQIVFDSTNHVTIRSAGKDRVFGDRDDIQMDSSER